MTEFNLDIIKPLFAILACLLLGGSLVYSGFQTVDLHGRRDPAGVVTLTWTREHFGGLLRLHRQLENVTGASLETSHTGRPGTTLIIHSAAGDRPLLAGPSELDDAVKVDALALVNAYLADPGRATFDATLRVRTLFGWVGLPILLAGLLGLVSLPQLLLHARGPD